MKRLFACMAILLLSSQPVNAASVDIAAVVNDKVISTLDLEERVDIVMATTGIPDTAENRSRLKPQILRQLVDEQLQREEGERNGISIPPDRLREGINQIERQSNKPEGSLPQFLQMRGLSLTSFEDQVRAQMMWSETVLKKIRPRIKISDQEVARYVARKTNKSAPSSAAPRPVDQPLARELKIAVLQLPVDSPKNEAKIRAIAVKLHDAIRAGAAFEAVAAQFSSSTGATRAEPFWVETAQLDPIIVKGLTGHAKGDVSQPVRTASGYQIVKLVDFRKPVTPKVATPVEPKETPKQAAEVPDQEPRAELAYKQILMNMKPDAQEKEAELLLKLSRDVARNPGKCEDPSIAGAGADELEDVDFTVTLNRANSDEMPEKLRELLLMMTVGSVSQPVVTPQGIRLFMLCERIDLPTDSAIAKPSAETSETKQAIYAQKLELEAQKYMRDLRRAAFVEIRVQ